MRGLGHSVDIRTLKGRAPRPLPFGWRYVRDWDRNKYVALPVWVYWPVRFARRVR